MCVHFRLEFCDFHLLFTAIPRSTTPCSCKRPSFKCTVVLPASGYLPTWRLDLLSENKQANQNTFHAVWPRNLRPGHHVLFLLLRHFQLIPFTALPKTNYLLLVSVHVCVWIFFKAKFRICFLRLAGCTCHRPVNLEKYAVEYPSTMRVRGGIHDHQNDTNKYTII